MKGLVKLFPVSYPIEDPLHQTDVQNPFLYVHGPVIPYSPSAAKLWFICMIRLLSFFSACRLSTWHVSLMTIAARCCLRRFCVCEGMEGSLSPASMYHHCQSGQGCASRPVKNINFTSPFPCNLSFIRRLHLESVTSDETAHFCLIFLSSLTCVDKSLWTPVSAVASTTNTCISFTTIRLDPMTCWNRSSTRGLLLRCRVTFACLSSFIHPVWG